MSELIIEAPQDAAGDAEAYAGLAMVDGKWVIQLRTTPLQSQSGGATTAQVVNLTFQASVRVKDDNSREAQRGKWFKEMRGWLMVVATVAASVTYQAGLNPPGGFWQDDDLKNGIQHHAGNPALRDEHRSRYLLFYYFNATAFVTSLVIIVLLMSERFYHKEAKVFALMLTTVVDLASLIGAYIAGTTRFFSSCIYVIVITCVAFVAVIYIGEVMTEVCCFVMIAFPCMETLGQKRWCPIPAGVVVKAKEKKAEMERGKAEKKRHSTTSPGGSNNTGTCCLCCNPGPDTTVDRRHPTL